MIRLEQKNKLKIKRLPEVREQLNLILELFTELHHIIIDYFALNIFDNLKVKLEKESDDKSKELLLEQYWEELKNLLERDLSIESLDQNQKKTLSNIINEINEQLYLLKTIIKLDNLEFN